jgi:hypothetical protein
MLHNVEGLDFTADVIKDRIATGVTRAVWTAAVLQCGMQMEKLPHYYFSWIVSFQKQRDQNKENLF